MVDRGIFSDLDPRIQVTLPAALAPASVELVVDPARRLVVLYDAGFPAKVYPLGGPAALTVGGLRLALRPGDRAELARFTRARELRPGEVAAPGDRDGDGIPDPLDVHLGGLKNAANAAPYIGGYTRLPFPGGDVARTEGVCTDVVIRAVRNAGLDLQAELAADLRRAPAAYPMVKRPDRSIDHRRVKTLLPYFVRRWTAVPPSARLRPGDVVFMDTFASKPGPDHIGVVSDRPGPSGLPLVVNAWTDGFVTSEMDLLPTIPVTHRFRIPPPR